MKVVSMYACLRVLRALANEMQREVAVDDDDLRAERLVMLLDRHRYTSRRYVAAKLGPSSEERLVLDNDYPAGGGQPC